MEIKPWLTAIHRKTISAPLKKLLELNQLNTNSKILDYGCGHGYDLNYLKEIGLNACGYDKYIKTFSTEDYNKETYDIVLCFYVLNTIKSEKERIEVLSSILDVLKESGHAYIAVRSINELHTNKNQEYTYYKDGIVTKKGTFQKYFDKDYLDHLITYNFENTKYEYIKFPNNTLFIKISKT